MHPRLQALENLCDLTLESWDHVFSHKLLSRLQFGDGAISTVHLRALRLRVEHPDEPYTSAEPQHLPHLSGRNGLLAVLPGVHVPALP